MQTTVHMTLVKETKNTYKFEASTPVAAPFREIYVQKSAFAGQQVPQLIKVTVEG